MTNPPTKRLSLSLLILGALISVVFGYPKDQKKWLRQESPRRGLQKQGDAIHFTDRQQDFFTYCRATLLSEAVLGDGLISQRDFTENLVLFCAMENVAGFQCPENQFSSLPKDLQLVFAFAVCPEGDGSDLQMKCLDGLDSLDEVGTEFGYIATDETMVDVELDVEIMCSRLFSFVLRKLISEFWVLQHVSSLTHAYGIVASF
jgi:hypothetical protein